MAPGEQPVQAREQSAALLAGVCGLKQFFDVTDFTAVREFRRQAAGVFQQAEGGTQFLRYQTVVIQIEGLAGAGKIFEVAAVLRFVDMLFGKPVKQ